MGNQQKKTIKTVIMTLNPIVSAEWLFENLDIPNLVILDASTKENKSGLTTQFPDIQLKGARHFDMETVFLDKRNNIPNMIPSPKVFQEECQKLGIQKNSVIVIYDNLGIYTSPRAWWMFKVMGHPYVAVLDGGLPAWIKSGYACEPNEIKKFDKGDFEANFNPVLVKSSKEILAILENQAYLIIDARGEKRFNGSVPEPRENMASGHIPNSKNLPYQSVLEDGKMKSLAALEAVFKPYNILNRQLVFTCGSGVTACIILLASELISLNQKSLYDGSWSEWGELGKFPVE
jgi:thiosulfate/3-mercaptopyruvate sulfurtransferase